jgi:hypothetical protein
MISWLAAFASAGQGVIYTLSGETVSPTGSPDQTAGIRFNSDGTVDKNENGTYSQIDSVTDWAIPNNGATGSERVRYTSHVGDAYTSEAAAENVYVAISGNPQWFLTDSTMAGPSNTATFQIDDGAGNVLASASYTLSPIKI